MASKSTPPFHGDLLDDFSMDEINDSFEEDVSNLIAALESVFSELDTRRLEKMLEHSLQACDRDSLEEKFFSVVLPVIHRIVDEALKKVEDIIKSKCLTDPSKNAKNNLLVCEGLLILWGKCVAHVFNLKKVPLACARSLVDIFPDTIERVFLFCRTSTDRNTDADGSLNSTKQSGFQAIDCAYFYKTFSSTEFTSANGTRCLNDILMSLFRTAYTILKQFRATLEGVIVFGTEVEPETELLAKVINTMGALAVAVNGLHLKTFVETYTTFARLALNFREIIKRRSPKSVTAYIGEMTEYVSSVLSKLQDSPDRIEERSIKATGVLLTLLVKLITVYWEQLTNDDLRSLVDFLMRAFRCSASRLRMLGIEQSVIDTLQPRLITDAGNICKSVLRNGDFDKAYFERATCVAEENRLGCHILTLNLIERVLGLPDDEFGKWIRKMDLLLDVAFTNISHLSEELHNGEEISSKEIYEATLFRVCSLICRTPPSKFHDVELVLLRYLLNGQLWSALLASDVWCFVSRVSSFELRESHLKYLMRIYIALVERDDCMELVVLNNLIGRLCELLPDERKHSFVESVDGADESHWSGISRSLSAKTLSRLYESATRETNIAKAFADLQERAVSENYTRFLRVVSTTGRLHRITEGETKILLQVWNCVANTIEDCDDRQVAVSSRAVMALLDCAKSEKIDEELSSSVLKVIMKSALFLPSHVRIKMSHYLWESVEHSNGCGAKLAAAYSELICQLLKDRNPWVFQEAVEAFESIAHACPNETLVTVMAGAVTRDSAINDSIAAYLSSELHYELHDFADPSLYVRDLIAKDRAIDLGKHVCRKYDDSEKCQKIQKTEKTPGSSCESATEESDRRIDKICNELSAVLEREDCISNDARNKLKVVARKILQM